MEMVTDRMNITSTTTSTTTTTTPTTSPTDLDEMLESEYAKSKKATPEVRSNSLLLSMSRENIPESRASQYPFRTIVQQYIVGKGSYTVGDIIEMMKNSAMIHDRFADTLTKIEQSVRTNSSN